MYYLSDKIFLDSIAKNSKSPSKGNRNIVNQRYDPEREYKVGRKYDELAIISKNNEMDLECTDIKMLNSSHANKVRSGTPTMRHKFVVSSQQQVDIHLTIETPSSIMQKPVLSPRTKQILNQYCPDAVSSKKTNYFQNSPSFRANKIPTSPRSNPSSPRQNNANSPTIEPQNFFDRLTFEDTYIVAQYGFPELSITPISFASSENCTTPVETVKKSKPHPDDKKLPNVRNEDRPTTAASDHYRNNKNTSYRPRPKSAVSVAIIPKALRNNKRKKPRRSVKNTTTQKRDELDGSSNSSSNNNSGHRSRKASTCKPKGHAVSFPQVPQKPPDDDRRPNPIQRGRVTQSTPPKNTLHVNLINQPIVHDSKDIIIQPRITSDAPANKLNASNNHATIDTSNNSDSSDVESDGGSVYNSNIRGKPVNYEQVKMEIRDTRRRNSTLNTNYINKNKNNKNKLNNHLNATAPPLPATTTATASFASNFISQITSSALVTILQPKTNTDVPANNNRTTVDTSNNSDSSDAESDGGSVYNSNIRGRPVNYEQVKMEIRDTRRRNSTLNTNYINKNKNNKNKLNNHHDATAPPPPATTTATATFASNFISQITSSALVTILQPKTNTDVPANDNRTTVDTSNNSDSSDAESDGGSVYNSNIRGRPVNYEQVKMEIRDTRRRNSTLNTNYINKNKNNKNKLNNHLNATAPPPPATTTATATFASNFISQITSSALVTILQPKTNTDVPANENRTTVDTSNNSDSSDAESDGGSVYNSNIRGKPVNYEQVKMEIRDTRRRNSTLNTNYINKNKNNKNKLNNHLNATAPPPATTTATATFASNFISQITSSALVTILQPKTNTDVPASNNRTTIDTSNNSLLESVTSEETSTIAERFVRATLSRALTSLMYAMHPTIQIVHPKDEPTAAVSMEQVMTTIVVRGVVTAVGNITPTPSTAPFITPTVPKTTPSTAPSSRKSSFCSPSVTFQAVQKQLSMEENSYESDDEKDPSENKGKEEIKHNQISDPYRDINSWKSRLEELLVIRKKLFIDKNRFRRGCLIMVDLKTRLEAGSEDGSTTTSEGAGGAMPLDEKYLEYKEASRALTEADEEIESLQKKILDYNNRMAGSSATTSQRGGSVSVSVSSANSDSDSDSDDCEGTGHNIHSATATATATATRRKSSTSEEEDEQNKEQEDYFPTNGSLFPPILSHLSTTLSPVVTMDISDGQITGEYPNYLDDRGMPIADDIDRKLAQSVAKRRKFSTATTLSASSSYVPRSAEQLNEDIEQAYSGIEQLYVKRFEHLTHQSIMRRLIDNWNANFMAITPKRFLSKEEKKELEGMFNKLRIITRNVVDVNDDISNAEKRLERKRRMLRYENRRVLAARASEESLAGGHPEHGVLNGASSHNIILSIQDREEAKYMSNNTSRKQSTSIAHTAAAFRLSLSLGNGTGVAAGSGNGLIPPSSPHCTQTHLPFVLLHQTSIKTLLSNASSYDRSNSQSAMIIRAFSTETAANNETNNNNEINEENENTAEDNASVDENEKPLESPEAAVAAAEGGEAEGEGLGVQRQVSDVSYFNMEEYQLTLQRQFEELIEEFAQLQVEQIESEVDWIMTLRESLYSSKGDLKRAISSSESSAASNKCHRRQTIRNIECLLLTERRKALAWIDEQLNSTQDEIKQLRLHLHVKQNATLVKFVERFGLEFERELLTKGKFINDDVDSEEFTVGEEDLLPFDIFIREVNFEESDFSHNPSVLKPRRRKGSCNEFTLTLQETVDDLSDQMERLREMYANRAQKFDLKNDIRQEIEDYLSFLTPDARSKKQSKKKKKKKKSPKGIGEQSLKTWSSKNISETLNQISESSFRFKIFQMITTQLSECRDRILDLETTVQTSRRNLYRLVVLRANLNGEESTMDTSFH